MKRFTWLMIQVAEKSKQHSATIRLYHSSGEMEREPYMQKGSLCQQEARAGLGSFFYKNALSRELIYFREPSPLSSDTIYPLRRVELP
jgi:hypothetical protein